MKHDSQDRHARSPGNRTPPPFPSGEPAEDEPILQPGTELGAYRICELIGEGGMGRVYLAEHARLGRKVALKLLRASATRDPKLVERFFREARAVNQINHEHIVQITDFVEGEGGASYYIMELLRGQTLGARMLEEGALPLDRVLSIGIQTCEALAAVHEQGIVHRDLKPDNIFLTERWGQRDFVKLLDFGVVKLTERSSEEVNSRTDPGVVLGTPAYMSPEQVSGKPVDHLSDIYTLGVILYEMVTGRKPFKGKSFGEMVIKHLSVKPPRPSRQKTIRDKLPPPLEQLIMRCLEKSPADRPESVAAVLEQLVAIAEGESCEFEAFVATVHSITVNKPRPRKRTGWLIAGLVAVAALGAALGIIVLPKVLGTSEGAGEPSTSTRCREAPRSSAWVTASRSVSRRSRAPSNAPPARRASSCGSRATSRFAGR
jgi:serine/threonine protein kinase